MRDETTDDTQDDDLDWGDVPVQEQLPLDEPVPYRLTSLGRRTVTPGAVPDLRVVEGGHTDLDDELAGTARVRARALRRAGAHTLDIAEELGVEPLHVEAWVADLPVPLDAGRSRRRRQLRVVAEAAPATDREDVRVAWQSAADDGRDEAVARLAAEPGLHSGLGIVSGLLEPDPHALVLGGEHLPLVAAAWSWVRATMEVRVSAARVLVRHEPGVAGDRVAHETATALGLDVSAVATTRDAGRVGRPPFVRVRVSDPALAGRVLGWQRALLAEVTDGAG